MCTFAVIESVEREDLANHGRQTVDVCFQLLARDVGSSRL